MLETALLLIGTIAFVLLGWAMYGRRGPVRKLLMAASLIILAALVVLSMAVVRP
ncbi:hypothetical protein [Aquisalimonas asiatica]|uniref:Uncharacterized protein n=1 Tax=Aquisalimonas asiatica TaxID=406100 RepID=A0A1H8Q8D4_9GAMM|nr:hypothetical protein [Aquisalimonas asiatica]SEO50298.1 hypothetical protein SAMN04488052_101408 [Aquisalimonas asiatica]